MLTTSTLRSLCSLLLLALLVGCGGPVSRVDWDDKGTQEQASEVPQVLVVSLTGKLGTTELARCHRAIRVAEDRGCSYVVFRLSDAGSLGEDAEARLADVVVLQVQRLEALQRSGFTRTRQLSHARVADAVAGQIEEAQPRATPRQERFREGDQARVADGIAA